MRDGIKALLERSSEFTSSRRLKPVRRRFKSAPRSPGYCSDDIGLRLNGVESTASAAHCPHKGHMLSMYDDEDSVSVPFAQARAAT